MDDDEKNGTPSQADDGATQAHATTMTSKERVAHLQALLDDADTPSDPDLDEANADHDFDIDAPSQTFITWPTAASILAWFPHVPYFYPVERRALRVIAILTVIAVGLGYFLSPLAQIKSIQVEGNTTLTKQEVLSAAGIHKGLSVLSVVSQVNYFSQRAKTNPQIKQMQIVMSSPNEIVVQVKEVNKIGYALIGKNFHFILADGSTLKQPVGTKRPTELPLYDGFNSKTELKQTSEQFSALSPAIRAAVSEILWSPVKGNANRLILFMNDGNEVLVSADELTKKMKYYPAMASQMTKKGVVDLQVGAYATPYGQ
ncbi:MAG: FtsQ-type POTRA domain-containing protein [Lactobacillaceae bacterium]|jgi:cell division protein FtsQ|nr:FtsQ-type POTRA domain-containing protein [Lactobacillaceae bacterium]